MACGFGILRVEVVEISLKGEGYHFRTITPNSHARILDRLSTRLAPEDPTERLRWFFGWNVGVGSSIAKNWLKSSTLKKMQSSSNKWKVERRSFKATQTFKSKIRFSTHGDLIWAHSSFPTTESDCIFFGPDTYRYFYFLQKVVDVYLSSCPSEEFKLIDIGAGSGAGGLFIAEEIRKKHATARTHVTLTDINPRALQFCRANAAVNYRGEKIDYQISDILKQVNESFDLILSNPPYMVDLEDSKSAASKEGQARMYRNGGGTLGIDLSLRIISEGAEKLKSGGLIALYTGIPILEMGIDPFLQAFTPLVSKGDMEVLKYEEIDPDVWGEELETRSYSNVERIAVMGLVLRKK
ncbi:hypothetical protein PROFUN_03484 [Planoprotostelium fungivorum]|uniref:Methyltransferase small domain-containing protein n=1 Tax=Planoprotostelium fungivorum TaxID=1890364 RepID=A0A2P6MN88_9EUKA|nr:hypothetical protein PROFUN_03484 [Planoprotostelium fungivorum]